ncbi:MAG TPA: sodium:proton antiporter [Gammaproteobacteria bacterium]|nr:sodium:proton antiporter [Gammaproteobacteria bacterium]
MHTTLTIDLVLILALGVAAQWLAWRSRIPAIILLSLAGILVGPVTGMLRPEQAFGPLLRPVIGLCVAVILFEGGLNLRTRDLRGAAAGVRRLVFVGVPLSWLLGAAAARYVGGFSWPVSLVFGAILVVTGPTVIIPLLRQSALNRRTASYLRWEAILNDPLGALIAVLVFQYFVFTGVDPGYHQVLFALGRALLIAGALGFGLGYLLVRSFQRAYVPEYLKAPVLLGVVLVAFSLSNEVQAEAGLLTVTVLGIVVGNLGLPSIDELRRFKEYITILLVSAVFILLTADLQPSILGMLHWRALSLLIVMPLAVRPIAILMATAGSGMGWRDRLLVAWVGPRGIVAAAVAGVFAPDMVAAGYPDARLLVPVIFTLVFVTVLLHGLSLDRLARVLGLAATRRDGLLVVGASPWAIELCRVLGELDVKVVLADSSWHRLRGARLAGVPIWFGEVLSERAQESLALNEIALLLAATSNDAYNALVCNSLAPELGSEYVYQLPLYDTGEDTESRGVARTLRGRIAFDDRAVIDELLKRHYAGWQFRHTRLTEAFTYPDYLRQCHPDAFQVLVVGEGGEVAIHPAHNAGEPGEGDTVVHYSPPREEPAPEAVEESHGSAERRDDQTPGTGG